MLKLFYDGLQTPTPAGNLVLASIPLSSSFKPLSSSLKPFNPSISLQVDDQTDDRASSSKANKRATKPEKQQIRESNTSRNYYKKDKSRRTVHFKKADVKNWFKKLYLRLYKVYQLVVSDIQSIIKAMVLAETKENSKKQRKYGKNKKTISKNKYTLPPLWQGTLQEIN